MMTNEELFEEWWSGKSADYQRMTAPIDIWLAACRISNVPTSVEISSDLAQKDRARKANEADDRVFDLAAKLQKQL